MSFSIAFRMSMAAGGVSESEEEIIIQLSGTGGTQTVSAASWTTTSTNTSNVERKAAAWGTLADGSGGVMVRGGAASGINYLEWSDNDGVNWTACNGTTGRTNVNAIKGLRGRTDSNTSGYRWVGHAESLGYEAVYYSNDGKSWSYSNRSSYSQNLRAPTYSYWDDDNARWIGTARTRDLYVSNTGSGDWSEGYASFAWNKIGSGSDSTPRMVFGHKENGSNVRKVVMSNESESLWYIDSNDISGSNQTTCTYHGNASGGNGDYDWGDYGKIDDPTNPGTVVDGWLMGGGTAGSGNSSRINGSKDGQNFYGFDANSPTGDISRLKWWEAHDMWTLYSSANGTMMESNDYGLTWSTQSDSVSGAIIVQEYSMHSDGNTMKMMVSEGNTANHILTSTGPSTSGNAASINITGDESAHSGVTQTVTFANGISAADATTQVKALFSGGSIPNYTVTDIDSTSFKVTSTATGDETNLSFSTSAGTGGSLSSTLTVTDGAG